MAAPALQQLLEAGDPALIDALRQASASARTDNRAVNLGRLLVPLLGADPVRRAVGEQPGYPSWSQLARAAADAAPPRAPGADFTFNLGLLADRVLGVRDRMGGGLPLAVVVLGAVLSQPDLFTDAADRRLVTDLRTAALDERVLFGGGPRPGPRPAGTPPGDLGFGDDLTAAARGQRWPADPLVGMTDTLEQVVALLAGRALTPVLVGDPGVGKSALVEGLAYRIARNDPLIPPEMARCRVVYVRADEVLAGTGFQGQLEERVRQLLAAAAGDPDLILFLDEIHALLDTQRESTRVIANSLKPALRDGAVRCVGATTRQEYDRHLATDQALTERLLAIEVREPSRAEALTILQKIRPALLGPAGRKAGIELPDATLAAAVRLAVDYLPLDRLPRKAVNLLKLAVADRLYKQFRKKTADPAVSPADLAEVVGRYRRLDAQLLQADPAARMAALGEVLRKRVHGQPEAIEAVVAHLSVHARGWLDRDRPIAVFLFLGPPGVGKTALAAALAEHMMSGADCLSVRDLTGYADALAPSRFQGASAGYVGYGETRTVFTEVRTRPHSVVAFEAVERGAAVFPLLLGILSGSAEDGRGVRTDFTHAVFVLTSTALSDADGFDALPEPELRRRLADPESFPDARALPAELLERVDRVVRFRSLGEDSLGRVLADRLTARAAAGTVELPREFTDDRVRRAIVVEATSGQPGNGRAVLRGLDDWLARAARGEDLIARAVKVLRAGRDTGEQGA